MPTVCVALRSTETRRLRAMLAVAAVALFAVIRAADAAVAYNEALWNSFSRYEADHVPAKLLFPINKESSGPKLFPLDLVWSVEEDCHGPSRPFPSPVAREVAGACEYKPTGSNMYKFWQKLPGDRLRFSNCYCYAADFYGGGWCYPGLAGGMGEMDPRTTSCADLSRRVVADGGVPVTRKAAVEGPVPAAGHYIALYYRPQSSCDFPHCMPDFHFLRRDMGGTWSQKTGEAPVTNRDADGKIIKDPQAARLGGGYTKLCGYFKVDPAKMKVKAQRTPDRVNNLLQRWREAGLEVHVTPLPYNPATDAVDPAARDAQRLQSQREQLGAPDPQQQQQQLQQSQAQALRQAPAGPTNNGRDAAAPASNQQQQQQPGKAGGRRLMRGGAGGA